MEEYSKCEICDVLAAFAADAGRALYYVTQDMLRFLRRHGFLDEYCQLTAKAWSLVSA